MNELEDKLKATVLAAALAEEKKPVRRAFPIALRWASAAVVTAAVAALLLIPRQPKDTFDSPELAYAELERTFAYIAQKIDEGTAIATKADAPIETIKNIFE